MRLTTLAVPLFVSVAALASLPAAAWVPVACDERAADVEAVRQRAGEPVDFRAAWQRYERRVRRAVPGDDEYVPHPYPRTPRQVFEDFRYGFLHRFVTHLPSKSASAKIDICTQPAYVHPHVYAMVYNGPWEVMQMRTNIDLDDELVDEARRLTGIETKKRLVDEALRLMVATHRRKSLLDLKGKIEFAPGYDHKALRSDEP